MNGVFCNRRWTAISNILGLICGIFMVILFSFLLIDDPDAAIWDIALAWFFIGIGILAAGLCGVSLYVNKKAFIRADADGISGYFHFGLALRCRIDDIEAVSYGGTGLNLQLKNGKKYNMHNLENAYALGRFIKQHLPLPPLTTQTKEKLNQTVQASRRRRRNCALGLIGCFVLIFAVIFLTAWLTDGREMRDFTAGDWQIFGIMAALVVLLSAAIVVLIRRFVRHSEVCHRNLEDLHLLILRTAPLPAGNGRKVYISLEDHPPIRVTVCGFPRSDEVYYIIEALDAEYTLEKVHESKIYPSMETLQPELEGLTEIQVL